MLVARSAEAAAHYSQEIAAGLWHKCYVAQVALLSTKARQLAGPHKAYLKVDGASARVVRAGGKPSFLHVALATPVPGVPDQSHVLVQLQTGRFHQIRVMPAHRGGGPTGRPLYLEHAILSARMFIQMNGGVWPAPRHPDRKPWASALSDAVDARAAALATSPVSGQSRHQTDDTIF